MLIRSAKELASYLRAVRKAKKMSQSVVSDQVGLKQDTVSLFELRPESTKLDTLFRILSSLGLEVHIASPNEGVDDSKHEKQTEDW